MQHHIYLYLNLLLKNFTLLCVALKSYVIDTQCNLRVDGPKLHFSLFSIAAEVADMGSETSHKHNYSYQP